MADAGPGPSCRRASWGALGVALLAALALVACCPAPAASAETPTAFAATVVDVDASGYWLEAEGGSRWRVAGSPPTERGERVYVEGAWTSSGAFRVDRATALPAS